MGKEYVMSIELPHGAKCVRTEVSEESVKVIYTSEETTANVVEQTTQAAVNKADDIAPENQTSTKLSIEDAFIWVDFTNIKKSDYKAKRKNGKQEELRQNILEAIKNNRSKGLYVAILEPSVDDDDNIYFAMGADPGTGYSAVWWNNNATKFCPERESRNLSFDEYFMILAHLIKNGDITWKEAAEDSRMKGNFWNSPSSLHKMEKTGTRKCGEFYGFVGNTYKYVKYARACGYALMGGSCYDNGGSYPVVDAYTIYGPYYYDFISVGWLVLHK